MRPYSEDVLAGGGGGGQRNAVRRRGDDDLRSATWQAFATIRRLTPLAGSLTVATAPMIDPREERPIVPQSLCSPPSSTPQRGSASSGWACSSWRLTSST